MIAHRATFFSSSSRRVLAIAFTTGLGVGATGSVAIAQVDHPDKPAAKASAKSPPAPLPLDKAATEAMVARFEVADHWVQQAVTLLSLNQYWHPSGSEMIVLALQDRDKRLAAYGIEALLRSETDLLPTVATPALLEELIQRQLSNSNKYYKNRVLAALTRLAPEAKATKRADWTKWWRATKATYQPKPWKARVIVKVDHDPNTVSFAARAFDLYTAGLDLTICIDSTGSMQPSINAVSQALGDMVDILKGISPKFRLGLVHYKEIGDFGNGDRKGAKIIAALSKNVVSARKKLLKLKAKGGGDLPERVANAMDLAYGKKMKWKPGANKLVILIGDAPPHETDRAKTSAERARSDPASVGNKGPTTGPKKLGVRPFITSTIGVKIDLTKLPPNARVPPAFRDSQAEMETAFRAIATAGGGIYEEMMLKITVNKRGQVVPTDPKKAGQAGQSMVEYILVLSFGPRFAREMHAFVRVFYDYRNAKLFK